MKAFIAALLLAGSGAAALAANGPDDARARSMALVQQARPIEASDPKKALDLLFQARDADRTNDQAYAELAGVLAGMPDNETAAQHAIGDALALNPRSEHAWWVAGVMALARKDWQGAAALMGKVAEINPRGKEAWTNRGHALYQLGRYQDAADAFRRALAIDPGYTLAQNNLAAAQSAIAEGKVPAPSIVSPEGNPRIQALLAEAANWKRSLKDARKTGEAALQRLGTGMEFDAPRLAEASAQSAPDQAYGWSVAGFVTGRLGDPVDALAMLNKAVSLDPKSAETLVRRGDVLTSLGAFGDAGADYAAALALSPSVAGAAEGQAKAAQLRAHFGRDFVPEAARRLYEAVTNEREADALIALEDGAFPELVYRGEDSQKHVSLLWKAVERMEPATAMGLIRAGANASSADANGRTALQMAVDSAAGSDPGARDLVLALVDARADPNVWASYGASPLDKAIDNHDALSFETLLAAGSNYLNTARPDGDSTMVHCASMCTPRMLAVALAHGGRFDAPGEYGTTALAASVNSGQVANYYVLRRAGAPAYEPYWAEIGALVKAIDADPAGPAARMIDAVIAGDTDAARRAAAEAPFTAQQARGAFFATMVLDDPQIARTLLDKGADLADSLGGVVSGDKFAYNRGAYKLSQFLNTVGIREQRPPAPSAEELLGKDLAEAGDLLRNAAYDLDKVFALIGDDPAHAPSAAVCRELFDADKEAVEAIRKTASVTARLLDSDEKAAMVDSLAELREERRSQTYPIYSRYSCKFYWTSDRELGG